MATVIKGGLLIDGTGQDPLSEGAIVIEGDSIVAVSRESEIDMPPGARIIDAKGKVGYQDLPLEAVEEAAERLPDEP